MQINELKKYIFENNKVEFILEQLGCHSIKYHKSKEYFSCANPDGDNKNAVSVSNNQYLNCRNYTRNMGGDDNADLLTLIQFYKNLEFRDAMKFIHQILELKFTYLNKKIIDPKSKQDPLNVFKKVLKRKSTLNVLDFETLSENRFYDFVPYIHTSWFREGIIKKTIDKFGLAYSYKYKRTVVPLRYWATGELLGFNMRTSVENYEEFDILKYYTTPNYPKSINLFGLWENHDSIIKLGYVVVGESEKSTLKRHSRNDESWVGLSGHNLSDEQIRILIGLNVEIVICLDEGLDIQESRFMCEKFYGIRNVSYIYDKWGLIKAGSKNSPADLENKLYEFMFKHRIKYDAAEHRKYLNGLKK